MRAFRRRLNLLSNRVSGTVFCMTTTTGGFPASPCDLPRLQNLNLSKNSLTGELPAGGRVSSEDEEKGWRIFACPCMRANTRGDSTEGSDGSGGEKKCSGGGGCEDREVVAIDKEFRMEQDELVQSSAYMLDKSWKGIVYKVVGSNR